MGYEFRNIGLHLDVYKLVYGCGIFRKLTVSVIREPKFNLNLYLTVGIVTNYRVNRVGRIRKHRKSVIYVFVNLCLNVIRNGGVNKTLYACIELRLVAKLTVVNDVA